MQIILNSMQIELYQGDITELSTDAITNAANSQLQLGGGVAGAIARKGGPAIQQECNKIGHCDVGKAVITTGGKLPAKYVIHAVGPRMGEGDEHNKLASAVQSTLELAEQKGLESVALPAISTGIFGFPVDDAAKIMADKVIKFSYEERAHLSRVVVALYDKDTYEVFRKAFSKALDELDDDSQMGTVLLRKPNKKDD
jgi:O-acetyl-ADP-ribose deacetylase (regulator of RNase III)